MATECPIAYRVIMMKTCVHFFFAVFHPNIFILAGNKGMHESSWSSNFKLIGPLAEKLAPHVHLEKILICLLSEKWCLQFHSAVLDQILFIFAGDNNIHESLGEVQPDATTGFHGNR